MSDEEIFTELKRLVERTSRARILGALTSKGVGSTTAERLVAGRYSAKPGGLLRAVLLDVIETNKAS